MEDRFKIWKMDSPILIDEYFFKRYFLIRKNAWIKNRRKKFFTTQVVREKLSQKIVQRFFDEKFFCMNKLFSLLHDVSLKIAVFSECTFQWFHIFRFWNYLIKENLHFVLKKCGNTTQRKGRFVCPYMNCSICINRCSISELLCKDIKGLIESQIIW